MVELRIFESDVNNDLHKTDITFAFNASFFLYATLDNASPFTSSGTAPVLTGVPVAGVAYLDRPTQAGYFIFPDLSVRHEGRYRLRFHLYEETKDPKDADRDSPLQQQQSHASSTAAMPQSFLNYRLDVKSAPFVVYSAKKFPGLATSTTLCHVIAEQGCRVRIRRDVRMRSRPEKGDGSRYATPDKYSESARSQHFSNDPQYAYAGPERPPSALSDYNNNNSALPPSYRRGPLTSAPASHRIFPTPQLPYASPSYMRGRNGSSDSDLESCTTYPAQQASPPPSEPSSHQTVKTSLPPLMLGYRTDRDPNAYQPEIVSPTSRLPALPSLRIVSADSPEVNNPRFDDFSKRSYCDAFPYEEQLGFSSARRKCANGGYGMVYKDARSEMEYKRANGRMAMRVHPTPY